MSDESDRETIERGLAQRHVDATPGVVDAIARGLADARERWSRAHIETARATVWVLERVDAETPIEALHVAELALCSACAAGDTAAIHAFIVEYFDELRKAVARRGPDIALDDAIQRLRERLFVGPEPRVGKYAGRGSLRGWVRVVAMRLLVDMVRERGLPIDRGELQPEDIVAEGGADPELGYIKARYAQAFRDSFAEAVTRLQPRQRNLLRQQLVHGATYEEIAAMYRVSRATAARWLAQARTELVTTLRAGLQASLGVAEDELESLVALIRSRIDLSLHRHLVTHPAAEP